MTQVAPVSPQHRVSTLRSPFGGMIGASIGASAWEVRALLEAQDEGMAPRFILGALLLISLVVAPSLAYWGLVFRRWSGARTLVVFTVMLAATNAAFAGAGRVLGVGGLLEHDRLVPALLLAWAVIGSVLLNGTVRGVIAANLENWRDTRR